MSDVQGDGRAALSREPHFPAPDPVIDKISPVSPVQTAATFK